MTYDTSSTGLGELLRWVVLEHRKKLFFVVGLVVLVGGISAVWAMATMGRIAIVTSERIERIIYIREGEEIRRERVGGRWTLRPGVYSVTVELDGGHRLVAEVTVRNMLRTTIIDADFVRHDHEQVFVAAYDGILPLGRNDRLTYTVDKLPLVVGSGLVGGATNYVRHIAGTCLIDDDQVLIYGHGGSIDEGERSFAVINYNLRESRGVLIADGVRAYNRWDIEVLCSGDQMYIIDYSRLEVDRISRSGVETVSISSPASTSARYAGRVIIGVGASGFVMLRGDNFDDDYMHEKAEGYDGESDGFVEEEVVGDAYLVRFDRGLVEESAIALGARNDIARISVAPGERRVALIGNGFVEIYDLESGERGLRLRVSIDERHVIWDGDGGLVFASGGLLFRADLERRVAHSLIGGAFGRSRAVVISGGFVYFTAFERGSMGLLPRGYRVGIER